MGTRAAPLRSPRLRSLARPAAAAPAPAQGAAGAPGAPGAPLSEPAADERCDLCGAALPAEHRHLVDLRDRRLQCACRACSLLFERRAAGGGHVRLVGERRLALEDFVLPDATWDGLQIPVSLAFFFCDSSAGRVNAFYPSPMGATESRLELDTWQAVQRANPVLDELEPDVEALLVDRRDPPRHWLVPIDDCYRLVALIRTRWRGFTGGREVWSEIDGFFRTLDARARPHRHPIPEGAD